MESIIHKKIDLVANILESKEFKDADKLLKHVNKMKDDIKKYCQKNEIMELKTEESEVTFYKRNVNKLDGSLLDPEIREKATIVSEMWMVNYKKIL